MNACTYQYQSIESFKVKLHLNQKIDKEGLHDIQITK